MCSNSKSPAARLVRNICPDSEELVPSRAVYDLLKELPLPYVDSIACAADWQTGWTDPASMTANVSSMKTERRAKNIEGMTECWCWPRSSPTRRCNLLLCSCCRCLWNGEHTRLVARSGLPFYTFRPNSVAMPDDQRRTAKLAVAAKRTRSEHFGMRCTTSSRVLLR